MDPTTSTHPFGAVALTLGPPRDSAAGDPWAGAAVLDRWLRAGGEPGPVTPTLARVTWDHQALHVLVECDEPAPDYPVTPHGANILDLTRKSWRFGYHLDSAYPDRVDLFLRRDWQTDAVWCFSVAKTGERSGQHCARWPFDDADAHRRALPDDAFEATVAPTPRGWQARFAVPWELVSGRPTVDAPFGLLLNRTRWRESERLSPVAVGFDDRPALDLFLETDFGAAPAVHVGGPDTLATLPASGRQRWQWPAAVPWPTADERAAVWQMLRDLESGKPTTPETLAERVHGVQRWVDLLGLEGFNFLWESGSPVPRDLPPSAARATVNRALAAGDEAGACAALDAYVRELAPVSARWFADGSPGNVDTDAWTTLDRVESVGFAADGHELLVRGRAGPWPVTLRVSFPAAPVGGLRVHAEPAGRFAPAALRPLRVVRAADGGVSARTDDDADPGAEPLAVEITAGAAWAIVLRPGTDTNTELARLGRGDLALRFAPDGSVLAVDLRGPLAPGEAVFGGGERFDAFDLRGRVVTLWGMDDYAGLVVGPRRQSYKPVPLFHRTGGGAMFVNSTYRLRADFGQGDPDRWRLTLHGPVLDVYFWPANADDGPDRLAPLRAFSALTGRPLLPPRWAFEPWMGGTSGRWREGSPGGNDPAWTMRDVAARFATLDLPHSAVYAEGGGCDDPGLHGDLAARGVRVFSWMNSCIPLARQQALLGGDVPPEDTPTLRHADGRPFRSKHSEYLDFSHPRAAEVVRAFWRQRLDLGMAGSMVDFGDGVPEDARAFDGQSGAELHNAYAEGYHRAFHDAFAERRGADHVLFARAAAAGSQRWACQFGGDQRGNFTGLQASLNGALSLSACGFSNWGSDLGGFFGWPDPEVYARWVAFACFSPLFRCHGTEPREPWFYGEEAMRVYRHHFWLRHNLLPYIYRSAETAHATGVPLMRPLPLAFPGQAEVAACGYAYGFGPHLLVAPVLAPGRSRWVTFPRQPGNAPWTHLWTGQNYAGGTAAEVAAPLDGLPVFLAAGARVPLALNGALAWGGSLTGSRLGALVVTPSASGAEDAGCEVVTVDDPGIRFLLVYGAEVLAVDGLEPRTTPAERRGRPPGWWEEPGRVVVRLPDGGRRRCMAVRMRAKSDV